eukprot:PhF_6_TR36520/c0_g1_i4/m.53804
MILLFLYQGKKYPISINPAKPLATCIPSLKDKLQSMKTFSFSRPGDDKSALPKTSTPQQLGLKEKDIIEVIDEGQNAPLVTKQDDEEEEDVVIPDRNSLTHVIKREGIVWKHIATIPAVPGTVLEVEKALLSLSYPMQLTRLMEGNPDMERVLTYDPSFCDNSAFDGTGEHTQSLLGKAYNRGIVVYTSEHGEQFAFYPKCFTIPHSCSPSAVLKLNATNEAEGFPVTLMATRPIGECEDVTISLLDFYYESSKASQQLSSKKKRSSTTISKLWPLMPKDRRLQMLREAYYVPTCECHRCTHSNITEKSLTGAFFLNDFNTDAQNQRLVAQMRNEFEKASTYKECILFLNKYRWCSGRPQQFVLHGNHWRMSTIRQRIIDMYNVVGTPTGGAPKVPTKETISHILDQLELLSKADIIAPKDVLRVDTFEKYHKIVKRMPEHLQVEVTALENQREGDIAWL